MGSVPKIIELKGPDAETAFNDTQQEARHVYGHSGTTGTVADADGCIVVDGPALLPWDCRRTAQQLLRDGHAKVGGPAFILKLADPAKTRTVKTVLDITNLTAGQIDDAIDTAVREKLPDDNWGIYSVEARDANAEGEERKGTLKTKITLTPGTGKRVTRYTVKHANTGNTLIEHETLPEAKNWMKEALATGAAPMNVVAETRKESGPLVAGQLTIVKQTVAITATIGTPNTAGNGIYLATGIFPTAE